MDVAETNADTDDRSDGGDSGQCVSRENAEPGTLLSPSAARFEDQDRSDGGDHHDREKEISENAGVSPGTVIGPVTGHLRGLGQDQNVGDVCPGWSVSWARSVARWSHNGAREMTPR